MKACQERELMFGDRKMSGIITSAFGEDEFWKVPKHLRWQDRHMLCGSGMVWYGRKIAGRLYFFWQVGMEWVRSS